MGSNMQGGGELLGVSVASPTLAWGVGYYMNNPVPPYTLGGSLIEKWTGGSSWAVVGAGDLNAELFAVSTVGTQGAWMVGSVLVNGVSHGLIRHWNGSSWSKRTFPMPAAGASGAGFSGVSAYSISDVWASGYYELAQRDHPWMEHFNGTTWVQVAMPASAGDVTDVIDLGQTDAWALGSGALFRYDGSSWTKASAQPPLANSDLAGASDADLWVISNTTDGPSPNHWNGSTWTELGTPSPDVHLSDQVEASTSTLWSVGYTTSPAFQPYIADNAVQVATPAVEGNAFLAGAAAGYGRTFAVGYSQIGNSPAQALALSCS